MPRLRLLPTIFSVVLFALSAVLCPWCAPQGAAVPEQVGPLGVSDWSLFQIAGQPNATSYVAPDGTITTSVGNIPVQA